MKSYILLENIEMYARHGVFPQENKVGNRFVVNVKITVDISSACETDALEDTLSYADFYEIIKEEMAIPSKLLEHVGGRIIKRLKTYSDRIEQIELKISKLNPPVRGQVESASVILID